MMNSNLVEITDTNQFEEIINSFESSYNKIKDLFANQKQNAEKINATDVWTGATAEVMYNKYKLLSDNFGPIEFSLEVYIKFLKKTLEDYKRITQEIDRNINDISESLDVVS